MGITKDLMIKYHHWANETLLKHIKQLGEEYYHKEVKSVFPSIKMCFTHIYQVDDLWMRRIIGEKETNFEGIDLETSIMAIEKLKKISDELAIHIENKDIITYQNTKGELFQNSIEDIVLHLMNHGTYHRGNVTAILHEFGERSISTDFIFFLRQEKTVI